MMFDGVFNHASSRSRWFQRFLNGRPGYEDFFVAFTTKDAIDPDYLRLILRPRTSDLLTPFRTINGMRYVWTTFSPDQVDLNFRNPRVLMRVVEILLSYVRRGADVVRLDAVTYIWRELGTSCAHLTETHALVKKFLVAIKALEKVNESHPQGDGLKHAIYMRDKVLTAMAAVRTVADQLEKVVADDLWPLPKYAEILFIK